MGSLEAPLFVAAFGLTIALIAGPFWNRAPGTSGSGTEPRGMLYARRLVVAVGLSLVVVGGVLGIGALLAS